MDGGGSITKVVVCDLEGTILHSFQAETINHYGAGTSKVATVFADISAELLSKFACLPGILFVGNSALDGRTEESQVQELTRGVFQPAKVVFHSDVYVALMGFTLGKPGAVLISGTGSMACGVDAEGNFNTAGGWGQVLGDEGSGYHMALKGIKAAIRAYDGLAENTQLMDRVMQFYDLQNMPELIEKVYNPPMEKSLIAAFAVEVAAAAEEGDVVARSILVNQAKWLRKVALLITKKCKTKNLGYYGSVLTRNETIRTLLSDMLEKHSIHLKAPELDPEIGALIGAFCELDLKLTEEMIDNLKRYNQ
jgi:N-acetylglucosamine kinase-like BadF-type ATPase